jgi:hypothetical protein
MPQSGIEPIRSQFYEAVYTKTLTIECFKVILINEKQNPTKQESVSISSYDTS